MDMEQSDSGILMRGEHITRVFKSGAETVYALNDVSLSLKTGALTVLRGRTLRRKARFTLKVKIFQNCPTASATACAR